jgi:hypothetical protein
MVKIAVGTRSMFGSYLVRTSLAIYFYHNIDIFTRIFLTAALPILALISIKYHILPLRSHIGYLAMKKEGIKDEEKLRRLLKPLRFNFFPVKKTFFNTCAL